jgi:hypothetical protein
VNTLAIADQNKKLSLLRRGVSKSRIPDQRNNDAASIVKMTVIESSENSTASVSKLLFSFRHHIRHREASAMGNCDVHFLDAGALHDIARAAHRW